MCVCVEMIHDINMIHYINNIYIHLHTHTHTHTAREVGSKVGVKQEYKYKNISTKQE